MRNAIKLLFILFIGIVNLGVKQEETYLNQTYLYTYQDTIPTVTALYPLKQKDVEYAARLINSECRFQSEKGQIAVVHTAWIRSIKKDHSFQYEIERKPIQFHGRYSKYWYDTPSEEIYKTARKALIMADKKDYVIPEDYIFYANMEIATCSWFRGKVKESVQAGYKPIVIGDHTWFKFT